MQDEASATTETQTQKEPVERRAFSIAEVAELYGVDPSTIYRRIYSGELPVLKGFGMLMVPEEQLKKFNTRVKRYIPKKKTNKNKRTAQRSKATGGGGAK